MQISSSGFGSGGRVSCSWRGVLVACLALALGASALGAAPEEPSGDDVRKFGVVGFYNPRLMYLKYQPLADYLTRHTPWTWQLEISTTYEKTVRELCSGELTMAYLGPFTYVRAHAACGVEPVARLNTAGKATYLSYVMVREDSPIKTLADLRGRRFGFGAELSASSHLFPRGLLATSGLDAGTDFTCVYFDHHERAARAVLLREVDACGVRDIIGERFSARGLRLLAESQPIPNFPFVLGPDASDPLREALLEALVDLPRREGEVALEMADWDAELAQGFVRTSDAEFDSVRAEARRVYGPEALTLPGSAFRCGGARR